MTRPTLISADEHIARHREALDRYLSASSLYGSCGTGDPAYSVADNESTAASVSLKEAWAGVRCAVPSDLAELARLANYLAAVAAELDEPSQETETAEALRGLRGAVLALVGWQRLQATISAQQGGK